MNLFQVFTTGFELLTDYRHETGHINVLPDPEPFIGKCLGIRYCQTLRPWVSGSGTGPRDTSILKTDTLDKANICNRQFQSAFTRESDDEIPSKGTSPFTPMGEITVDPNGVLKLLNNLKIHKAPGPDGLSARVLKECSSEIAPILALIYNETLAQGTVPDDWRQANVAPIFKKGEKYDAANYRPVSLTCICCKTLEHIIVSNINKHLAFESILADCQHGFRSQRSCETQLVQFFHDLVGGLGRALGRGHRQTDVI